MKGQYVIWKHQLFDVRNDDVDEEEPDLCNEEDKEDIDYMSEIWLWNKWEAISDDDEVEGPVESDHYNGDYGLKLGIGN